MKVWRLLRTAYESVPDDAACAGVVAFSMPFFMFAHMLAPSQDAARLVFSLSLAVLAVLVGYMIGKSRELLGYAVVCLAVGWGGLTVGVFVMQRLTGIDNDVVTLSWRVSAALQQGIVAAAWGILAVMSHRWLSRLLIRTAFVAALLGFAWSLYVNFQLPDPLTDPAQWGEAARLISSRTASPAPTMALAVALWAVVLWLWHRWWSRWLARRDDERLR